MMRSRGFTLTELLVVIAIIAVLAGVAYPLTTSMIGRSREAACLGKLRTLGIALEGYLQEHNRKLPELQSLRGSKADDFPVLETVLLPYVDGAEEAFRCPADHVEFKKTGSSYLWNSTQSGLHESKLAFFGNDRPDKVPLIADKEDWHPHGTNFLYADQSISNKVRFKTNR